MLAAGFGKRLLPITQCIPKCLVPINGRPLLEYWLELLTKFNHRGHIYINTHYLHGQVRDFISNRHTKKQITIINEVELLGTAGTLCELSPKLTCDNLLLVHADNLSLFNLSEFFLAHKNRPSKCQMTMMTFETDTPQSCGIVELNENQILIGYEEKPINPKSRCANAAVYFLDRVALEKIKSLESPFEFSVDIVPKFIDKTYIWQNLIYHRDIGTPASYNIAGREFPDIYKTFYET